METAVRSRLAKLALIGARKRWEGTTPISRFWNRVKKTKSCWIWTGGNNGAGYGKLAGFDGKPIYAHRFSWQLHRGPISKGLFVLHRCDDGRCIRPDHLFLGTQSDNMKDCANKKRLAIQRPNEAVRRAHLAWETKRRKYGPRGIPKDGQQVFAI